MEAIKVGLLAAIYVSLIFIIIFLGIIMNKMDNPTEMIIIDPPSETIDDILI